MNTSRRQLKRDLLGSVCRLDHGPGIAAACVERDTGAARWWLRPVARRLAAREARALTVLQRVPGVPRLLAWDGRILTREWIDGQPLQHAPLRDARYSREALQLVRRLHAAGIVHNDLGRSPNWLVAADGSPALVDFQRAMQPGYRGWRFRALAYDDLRHLLRHKRRICPDLLTARQRRVLARRCLPAAIWVRTGTALYRWLTRQVPGGSDR